MDKMREDIRRDLSYMTYAPILFISAAHRSARAAALRAHQLRSLDRPATRITTGMLNNVLEPTRRRASSRPRTRASRLKIYYMTQVGVCPPHFVMLLQ